MLGGPTMSKPTYSFFATERNIGDMWKKNLLETMAEGGREEKRLAEERESYHQGVPAIAVILDGGWSKSFQEHLYNANSGVCIILCKETGNILYIGVRNKYCHACARNISLNKNVRSCNWSESSSEIETDIILQQIPSSREGAWCAVYTVYWRR